MKFKKPKLICYDWDNTIVNTNPITLKALNLLYSKYGMPELTMTDIIRINGYYFADMFTAIFGKKNTLAIQQEYQSIYDNYAKCMLQPLVGAVETIKMMNDFGIKQVVISNKPSYIVKREAEAFHVLKYFELIIGPTDSGYAKPDPRMFDPVYEKVEFKDKWFHPNKLWFFGDALVDAEFAKAINARLFFLGDPALINDFPLDQLVPLNAHSDLKNLEFEQKEYKQSKNKQALFTQNGNQNINIVKKEQDVSILNNIL